MKKIRLILAMVVGGVLLAGAGAGAAWWGLRGHGPASAPAAAAAPVMDTRIPRYVSLEKLVVMLRRDEGETSSHYLAMDLVLTTSEDDEKTTRDQLPMLRSVALRALSTYTGDKAGAMTIDQFSKVVNAAFGEAYAHDKRRKPFSEAMISKLIIE